MPGLGDHERGPGADDLAALAEDHLGAACVSVLTRELHRPRGRLDVGEPHHSSLHLRDRLLGDDDDVAVLQPACSACGGMEQAAEVLTLDELREPFERDDADPAGAGPTAQRTPVTRMPACAL